MGEEGKGGSCACEEGGGRLFGEGCEATGDETREEHGG